jgi:tagatose 6-phosphate kinase
VCTALNPALDITYISERFVAGEANRVSRVHAQAGGKAVNVARLLHQAGHDVVVTGLAGGLVGDEIADHLDGWPVPHRLVRCAADSRRTVSAFSTEHGAVTAYNESGPPIAAAEWARFVDGFSKLVHGAAVVVLSGSLPAGLPAEAKPSLVKPNEHELAEAAGLPVPVSLPAAARAARQLLADGAQGVVVSLGARGLLGVLPGMTLLATPPTQRGNPVGAGDAAFAALVQGHLAGQPWPDRLRRAAAMSAAAVRQPVAGVVRAEDVAELEALIAVSEL